MIFLRQSTASQEVILGPFVDSTDGVTPENALTIANTDIQIWKSGAITLANKNLGGATYITGSNGLYYAVLDATDTDTVGGLDIHVYVTGALPIKKEAYVLEEAIYDALFATGASGFDANARVDVAAIAGVAQTGNDNGADINAILVDTNALNDTKIPDTISLANINAQVDTALTDINLDKLVSAAVIGTDVTDNSIIARMVSSAAIADWDTFVNTTDSLQALRDRGDAAWTTGGGGSITDIVSWQPLIPTAIDLANTKPWRLGIAVTNMLDDLPTTLEITPGTISIERAAQGGTTWAAVVTDAPMSESDGLIYYDEVFDTATGYAAGDVIRITFKGQTVTVSANDYNITPAAGQMFYTGIIAVNPDVNIAQISGSSAAADALELFSLAVDQGTGQLDAGSFQAGAISSTAIADGAITSAKFGPGAIDAAAIGTNAIDADALAADAVTEIQSGLATSAALATVDANVDAILVDTGTTIPATLGTPAGLDLSADIAAVQATANAVETDTQDIQSRLPTTLNNGAIQADIQRINDVAVVGDGSITPFTV